MLPQKTVMTLKKLLQPNIMTLMKCINLKYLTKITYLLTYLLGNTENQIIKGKNGENVSDLEIIEVVLVQCNIVNNDYQQNSRILYTFVPYKQFGSLLEIAPTNFIFLKTFNSELSYIEVWFTDQKSQPLEIEDRINLTLVIK